MNDFIEKNELYYLPGIGRRFISTLLRELHALTESSS